MEFRALGALEVRGRTGCLLVPGRRKQRLVLAVLLLRANTPVSVETLLDTLWNGAPPPSARANLQSYVSDLRRLLRTDEPAGEPRLHRVRGGYLIRAEGDELDITLFERLADEGRRALSQRRHAIAAQRLAQALAWWRGPVLQGLPLPDALRPEVERLHQMHLATLEDSIETRLGLDDPAMLAAELTRLTAAHPLRERLWAQLMLALYRCGRQAEAVETYQRVYRLLDEELGMRPGPALRRLHHQVLTADPALDPPTTAHPRAVGDHGGRSTSRVPAQLPPDVRGFVGRQGYLRRLDTLLDNPSGLVAVIAGTAGVGKSALAVHWAHRVRGRFPDGQLYLNLHGFSQSGTVLTPSVAMHRLLTSLGLHPAGLPADLDAQTALYRTELADKRLVLLLDNARDSAQVRPLLPGSATTAVLITSRRQLTSLVAMEGADQILLDLLSDEEAMRLLAVRLGEARVAGEREAAADIVSRCARLPLALTVAASRAAQRPSPLREIAAELVDHKARLDFLTAGDAVSEVRSAFSWSYTILRPSSAELFRLLGLHGTPEFSAPVAAALIGVSLPEVRPLLDELARASLLTRTAGGRFTCHDLLRAYALDRTLHIDTGERHRRAVDRMLRYYLNTAHHADRLLRPRRDPVTPAIADGPALAPPVDAATAMTWFTTEQSALLAALRHCQLSKLDTYTWQFAWVLTTFLTRRGPWTELASAWESALLAAERLADPLMRADAHRHLAQVHTDLHQYGRAIGHFRRAMRLYEAKADPVGVGHTSFGMSLLRERQGRPEAALQHAQRSHHSFAAAGHQPGQAVALNAIAWCHAELGHCRSALAHGRRALALFQTLDDEHGQGDTWDTIGFAHHRSGEHEVAARAYQTAVDLYRRCGDRYYEAGSLTRLGDAQHAAANTILARAAWQEARSILVAQAHPMAALVAAKLRTIDRLGQMPM